MRTWLIASVVLGLAASSCVRAQRVELRFRDLDAGRELPVHLAAGARYLEGAPGSRYAIVLSNRSAERVLVVLSVDGVNVITGQTASPSQAGYVLEAGQQVDVSGWRKSLAEVAEFRFAALPDSYAARTGRPENVGVIGAAVFTERRPYWLEESKQDAAAGRAAAPAAAPAESATRQQLGTAHGERRYDPAQLTRFDRASAQPIEISQIYYDSREALVSRGIIAAPCCSPSRPQAFPLGFVPDP